MVWNWLRRHPALVDVALGLALAAGYIPRAGLPRMGRRRGDRVVAGLSAPRPSPLPASGSRGDHGRLHPPGRRVRTDAARRTGRRRLHPRVPLVVPVSPAPSSPPRYEALVASAAATAAATIALLGLGDFNRAASDL